MQLVDWLKKEGKTPAEFALAIDVDKSNVSRWLSGEVRPGWKVIPKIIDATNGEVTANDFVQEASAIDRLNADDKAVPRVA